MTRANESFITVIACLGIEWWDIKHDVVSIISYQLSVSEVAEVI